MPSSTCGQRPRKGKLYEKTTQYYFKLCTYTHGLYRLRKEKDHRKLSDFSHGFSEPHREPFSESLGLAR